MQDPDTAHQTGRPAEPTTPIDDGEVDIRKILESLIPEAGAQVRFRDVTGALHEAPAFASLRVQAKVLGLVRDNLAVLQSLVGGGNLAAVMAALTSPEVVDLLVHAMTLLHPRAIEAARANLGSVDPVDAGDLFAVEEIVEAVVPFFAGPTIRLLAMIEKTGPSQT